MSEVCCTMLVADLFITKLLIEVNESSQILGYGCSSDENNASLCYGPQPSTEHEVHRFSCWSIFLMAI